MSRSPQPAAPECESEPLLLLTGALLLLAVAFRGLMWPLVQAAGRPYFRYKVGTTNMFSSVELASPQRITMAIGV